MHSNKKLMELFTQLGLEDFLTHHGDFCTAVSAMITNGKLSSDDQLYWQRQMRTLNNLKIAGEKALPELGKGELTEKFWVSSLNGELNIKSADKAMTHSTDKMDHLYAYIREEDVVETKLYELVEIDLSGAPALDGFSSLASLSDAQLRYLRQVTQNTVNLRHDTMETEDEATMRRGIFRDVTNLINKRT